MTEINTLKFKIFHISSAKNYLSDCGSQFLTGAAGADKGGDSEFTISRLQQEEGANECKIAQIFAFWSKLTCI